MYNLASQPLDICLALNIEVGIFLREGSRDKRSQWQPSTFIDLGNLHFQFPNCCRNARQSLSRAAVECSKGVVQADSFDLLQDTGKTLLISFGQAHIVVFVD